ncbi:MAG: hypothetical protein EPN70_03375 [Paraburkholderia sp.]|uniref:hypothetical protein n=1 Tax=Paraburkholderia sp. TaxID=1926495 RepID=UPI00122ADF9A|nr:hypothetical protein [Paraburkholderia sp.]TAM07226.1 MAG: hypothetical protein EPN70_03375 [Paraburkholderia sp.]TAM32636.1 MAG: hypothetical protein EPN59_01685 [Paraburkholderia sp.]
MTTDRQTGWTTSAEIDFIDQLASKHNAIALLQGYLAGMSRRVDFGQMDPLRVTAYAHERLDAMLRKLAA